MATIATIIALAGSAYAGYSATQAQEKQTEMAMGMSYGNKPSVAHYEPVDFSKEQRNAILGNIGAMPDLNNLMRWNNNNVMANDLTRARRMIPGYGRMMKLQGQNAESLLRGQMPYDDVLDIVADRSGANGSLGTPGTAAPATFRDLGLKRIDAMNMGSGMMKGMMDIADRVSPVSRQFKPQDAFLSPLDRIKLAIDQNQLIQQSEQSAHNIEAGLDPTTQARQMVALSAAGRPGPEADYAQYITSALGAVAGAYDQKKFGMNGGSTGLMDSGFYTDPTAAYKAYGSEGFSPVIMSNPNGKGYYSPYSIPA